MYCVIDNAEPDGAIVRISLAVVSLQRLVLLHAWTRVNFFWKTKLIQQNSPSVRQVCTLSTVGLKYYFVPLAA